MPVEPPQSAWLDFLDWARQPGQAVLNLNRPQSALHHLEDFASGPISALIPGYSIPKQSTAEDDEVKAGRLVETLANPLLWTAAIPGVGKGIGKALAAGASQVAKGVDKAGLKSYRQGATRALGWEELGETMKLPDGRVLSVPALTAKLEGLGEASSAAGTQQIGDILSAVKGLTTAEDLALANVIDNVHYRGKTPEVLDALNWLPANQMTPDYVNAAKKRLATWINHPAHAAIAKDVDPARMGKVLDEYYGFADRQLAEAQRAGGIAPGRQQHDYLKREYEGLDHSSARMQRQKQEPADVVQFLQQAGPDVDLNQSFVQRALSRANSQGRILKKAALERELLGSPQEVYALRAGDPAAMAKLDAAVASAGRGTDLEYRLKHELGRTEPVNYPGQSIIQNLNRVFKPAAVYGVGPFVRLGAIVRNQVGGVFQQLTSKEGLKALGNDPIAPIRNMWGAIDDGIAKNLFGNRLDSSYLTQTLDAVEQAAKNSGGEAGKFVREIQKAAAVTPDVELARHLDAAAAAVENGVLSGFVLSEHLAPDVLLRGSKNPINLMLPGRSKVANIGGKMFQGLEQRMRFGTFMDMVRNQGLDAATAAKKTKDIYLDYGIHSPENKFLRDLFPFGQFVGQSMKQQGKWLSQNPALLPIAAALFGSDDDTKLPEWAKEQAGIPIPGGKLVGFGSPMETFNMIPGGDSLPEFLDSTRRVASAAHPLLGMAAGLATGTDTFTGKPYLQDARLPGRDPYATQQNIADVAYGAVEDSGLAMPFTGPIQQAKSLGKMGSPAEAVGRWATGLNPIRPDQLFQAKQDLSLGLRGQPGAVAYSGVRPTSDAPPDIREAIDALRAAQSELSKRRKAAAAAAGAPATPVPQPGQ